MQPLTLSQLITLLLLSQAWAASNDNAITSAVLTVSRPRQQFPDMG